MHSLFVFWSNWPKTKKSAVSILPENDSWFFSCFGQKKRKTKYGMNPTIFKNCRVIKNHELNKKTLGYLNWINHLQVYRLCASIQIRSLWCICCMPCFCSCVSVCLCRSSTSCWNKAKWILDRSWGSDDKGSIRI